MFTDRPDLPGWAPTADEDQQGCDGQPVAARLVHAGSLTALLEGIDLRRLSLDGVEIVRRLAIAVRDPHWNTLPNEVEDQHLECGTDYFSLDFVASCQDDTIDFRFRGNLSGTADGTVSYSFEGTAARDFEYARIGICVLHPIVPHAGQPFRSIGPRGSLNGQLPILVEPQRIVEGVPRAMFPPYDELRLALSSGGEVSFAFVGDLFEMEDQRNWTDASFKSYSTPFSLGRLHRKKRGEGIRQSVRVGLVGAPAPSDLKRNELRIGSMTTKILPSIGFAMEPDWAPPSKKVAEHLRAAAPDHLRVDLDLSGEEWPLVLRNARALSRTLRCPLEVAVFVDDSSLPRLDELGSALGRDTPLARVLVFSAEAQSESPSETTPPGIMAAARMTLRAAGLGAPIGGGTDMYFAELNRTPPDASLMDLVAFAVVPQVHVEDDLSLFEELEGQADAVRSGLALAQGKPLVVGPITLRHRKPFYGPPRRADALSFSVDARQTSRLLAAWTLGSVKSCAEAGASSLTFFETSGPRGLIEREDREPISGFPSRPGMVFPVHAVFRELGTRKGARIIECASPNPLDVTGLGLVREGLLTLFAANLTARPQRIDIPAMKSDAAVRPVVGRVARTETGGCMGIALDPHSIAALHTPWID